MDVQDQKTAVRTGDVNYSVDISKIPYLSHFVSFQRNAKPGSSENVHDAIPLFDVALKGVESGYRHCLRSLPAELFNIEPSARPTSSFVWMFLEESP